MTNDLLVYTLMGFLVGFIGLLLFSGIYYLANLKTRRRARDLGEIRDFHKRISRDGDKL